MPCPIHKAAGDGSDPGRDRPVEEEGVIQRFLSGFSNILRQYFSSLVEALEAGAIDPAAGGLALELRERFDPYRDSFELVFTQGHLDGYETGRESAIRQQDLEISFDVTHEEVEDRVIEHAQEAAEQTELTLVGNLRDALVTAHHEGYGIPKTTQLLQDEVFDEYTEGYAAERVARTEVVSSANHGSFDAYRESGATKKQWLSTDDSRTRLSHVKTDNQERAMDEPFETGAGNEAMFPGSTELPVSDRANCRCSLIPLFGT
jgi:hypothetical protein